MTKSTSKLNFLLPALLSLSLLFTPFIINAQGEGEAEVITPKEVLECPIKGLLSTELVGTKNEYTISDSFSADLSISNQTNYILGGVRVGVLATHDETSEMYWHLLPNVFQLNPDDNIQVPLTVDTKALEAGRYTFKVFTAQGDDTRLFGLSQVDRATNYEFKVVKEGPATGLFTSQIRLNGEIIEDRDITLSNSRSLEATIETTKNPDVVLGEGRILVLFSSSQFPISPALISSKTESIKLIGDTSRVTSLQANYLSSNYTHLFTALIEEGSMQPVKKISVRTGEETISDQWPFLSLIGVSSLDPQKQKSIIACVDYVAEGEKAEHIVEPLKIDFSLSSSSKEFRSTSVETDQAVVSDYFEYSVETKVTNFVLETSLSHKRLTGLVDVVDSQSTSSEKVNIFTKGETVNLTLNCTSKNCYQDDKTNPTNHQVDTKGNSFWFYFLITIISLLLLFLVLVKIQKERLGIEPDNDHDKEKNNEEEVDGEESEATENK